MPYSRNSDLPPAVRDRYSERCQSVFRETFNNAMSSATGGGAASESSAFKIAHTAAGNCQRSTSKRSPLAMTDETETPAMAVKFAEGSDHIIEGIGIPFGGPFAGKDIQGEYFAPDTDFCLDWFDKRPLLYHHGLHDKVKTSRIGVVTSAELTDDGVFVQAELDKRSRYYKVVKQLIDNQGLGFSSGALPHLVQTTKDGKIKRWPYVEQSVTPTEANPDAYVAYAVKASDALDHLEAADIDIPAPVEAALKALDEWATEQTPGDSEPESLADHSQRVLAEVKAWVERMEERSDFRAKSGRELSRANVETLREAHRIIGELLARADKPREDEAEAAKSRAKFLRLEAIQLGASPD